MSCVAAFHNFKIELSHFNKGIYTSIFLRTTQHPLESIHDLYARILAYCHCYEEGLILNSDIFSDTIPAIYLPDPVHSFSHWIHVGANFTKKKLQTALHANRNAQFSAYFSDLEQLNQSENEIRGTKELFTSHLQSYLFDQDTLLEVPAPYASRSYWSVNVVDNDIYLSFDNLQYNLNLQLVDMHEYPARQIC